MWLKGNDWLIRVEVTCRLVCTTVNPTLVPPSNTFSSFYLTLVLFFPLPIVSLPPVSFPLSSLTLLSISGLHRLPGWSFWCGEALWSTTGPDEISSRTPWRLQWTPRCFALRVLLGVSVVTKQESGWFTNIIYFFFYIALFNRNDLRPTSRD